MERKKTKKENYKRIKNLKSSGDIKYYILDQITKLDEQYNLLDRVAAYDLLDDFKDNLDSYGFIDILRNVSRVSHKYGENDYDVYKTSNKTLKLLGFELIDLDLDKNNDNYFNLIAVDDDIVLYDPNKSLDLSLCENCDQFSEAAFTVLKDSEVDKLINGEEVKVDYKDTVDFIKKNYLDEDQELKEDDCGTENGVLVKELVNEKTGEIIEKLYDRIVGRFTNKKIINPETKETIIEKGDFITDSLAEKIVDAGVKEVEIRNVITCNTSNGVCQKCYGRNLATGKIVEIGEAVGVMAAQAIGEPGTQLTLRTFHSGGVADADDITQGLPRVEELFEARNPKGKATIAEIDGKITKIEEDKGKYKVIITNEKESKEHVTTYHPKLAVKKGDMVEKGDKLTEGAISPKELLDVTDSFTAQEYILKEVQGTYRGQGVDISDKHIEVIVKRMISKMKIINPGDTTFLPGLQVSFKEFREGNKEAVIKGKKPATGKPVMQGITKASLDTESFLAAASFQETTRVLTDAAVRGKVDTLEGLKENVLIGKLIPAGTGSRKYRKVDYTLKMPFIESDPMDELEEQLMD